MNQFNFTTPVWTGNIINLDIIDTPSGVELENGVIIFLGTRFCGINTVHISIPITDTIDISNIGCCIICPQNLRFLGYSLARNTPQNVDSEFQSQAMDIISQWFKTLTISCTGKTVYCWQ